MAKAKKVKALTPEEEAKVSKAVKLINQEHVRGGVAPACKIGDYILKHFYGGDIERYRSKDRKEHQGLRRLAADPRLRVSGGVSYFSRCVGISDMLPQLPKGTQDKLRISELVELLPINDATLRDRLAEKAAAKPLPIRQFRQVVREERIKAKDLVEKPKKEPRPGPRRVRTAAKKLTELLPFAPLDVTSDDGADMRLALDQLKDGVKDHLAKIRRHARLGVATSQHPEESEGAAVGVEVDEDALWDQVQAIARDSGGLDDLARWKLLRDAQALLRQHYEQCPRPDPAALLRGIEPEIMPGGYGGSKQPVVKDLVVELAKLVPSDGPFSRVLCEPFSGLAAVSRYALQLGIVDEVRLNDADPAVAALLTMIINDPTPLVDVLTGDGIPSELSQDYLDRLWEDVQAGRRKADDVMHMAVAPDVSHLEERDPETLTADEREELAWAEEASKKLEGLRAKKKEELTTAHLEVELAYAAVVLLQCSRGRGLAKPPTEEWAQEEWNPQLLATTLERWHRVLRGRVVGNECTCRSAFEVLREPGWRLALVDPPYDGTESRYSSSFGEEEHEKLKRILAGVRGRRWLLTYGDTPFIRSLYPGDAFNVVEHEVPRPERFQKEVELWITSRPDTSPEWERPSLVISDVR